MPVEQARNVFVLDIGQVLADGGREYFTRRKGQFSFRDRASLAIVYDDFVPLPGSIEGVGALSKVATFGGYYTVRPPELKQQGTNWLTRYNFPDAENIHTCVNHEDKVRQIINDLLLNEDGQNNRSVVLIDDNLDPLLSAAEKLVDQDPPLKQATEKLILVGFGKKHQDMPQGGVHLATGIRTFSLSSWENQNRDDLIGDLQMLYQSHSG
ncbi:MAG TPA: hypothetical protein VM077_03560 [Candidatus Limnocylindrales bacterium]|nr:hypothetical protein [Candidatus Limnocylindrales bacterium]